MSIGMLAFVGAVVAGATGAFFSDTETSTGNTFTAGTIDITVSGDNFSWVEGGTLADMKPSYTDYLNFTIYNTEDGANPVNIWKQLLNVDENTVTTSEPECLVEDGSWTIATSTPGFCVGNVEINDLSNEIIYDLYVTVYDDTDVEIWNQTIYVDSDGKSVNDVYDVYGSGADAYLGMIPAYGHMEVSQSYHFADAAGNEYQSDEITLDIEVKGEQLRGEAWLENKTAAPDYKIVHNDGIEGTLTYKVKHPTFDFSFIGVAPQVSTPYTLLYAVDPWPQTGSIVLGTGTTDASGNITITGDLQTGHMKDAKIWLVLSSDWSGTQMTVWNQVDYLLESGLIWYDDTDL